MNVLARKAIKVLTRQNFVFLQCVLGINGDQVKSVDIALLLKGIYKFIQEILVILKRITPTSGPERFLMVHYHFESGSEVHIPTIRKWIKTTLAREYKFQNFRIF